MTHLFKRKKMMTDQSGFTLLEVLIAMAIGTIGVLSLALMQGNAIRGNVKGSKLSQATFLAQNRLEQIKDGNIVPEGTYGFIDMAFYNGPNPIVEIAEEDIDVNGDAGGPFDLSYRVDTNTDWSRRVTVTVSWQGELGLTRTVVLDSISRGDGN